MRKALLIMALLAAFAGNACKHDNEAPPEQDPIVQYLNLTTLNGVSWDGTANIQSCSDNPVASACLLLEQSEKIALDTKPVNFTLILTANGNAVNGTILFLAPQYGGTPVAYTFGVTGTSNTGSTVDRVITLSQTSVSPTASPTAALLDFSAEQAFERVSGKFRLQHDTSGSRSIVLYSFALKKAL